MITLPHVGVFCLRGTFPSLAAAAEAVRAAFAADCAGGGDLPREAVAALVRTNPLYRRMVAARVIVHPAGRSLPPVQRWYVAGGSVHEAGTVFDGKPFCFAEVAPMPEGDLLPEEDC